MNLKSFFIHTSLCGALGLFSSPSHAGKVLLGFINGIPVYGEVQDREKEVRQQFFSVFHSNEVQLQARYRSPDRNSPQALYENRLKSHLTLWARPTLQEPALQFYEETVVGDGDCAFRAMGISRQSAYHLLMRNSYRLEVRRSVAPEIRASVAETTAPRWILDSEELQSLLKRADRFMRERQNFMNSWNHHMGLGGPHQVQDPKLLLQMLQESQDEDATELDRLLQRESGAEADLQKYYEREDVYREFINDTVGKGAWLTYLPGHTSIIDALAVLVGVNLSIWGRADDGFLVPLHEHITWPDDKGRTRFLLHTVNGEVGGAIGTLLKNHWNHFNRLIPAGE